MKYKIRTIGIILGFLVLFQACKKDKKDDADNKLGDKLIVFTGTKDNKMGDIFICNPSGKAVTKISTEESGNVFNTHSNPIFSPDGKYIMYLQTPPYSYSIYNVSTKELSEYKVINNISWYDKNSVVYQKTVWPYDLKVSDNGGTGAETNLLNSTTDTLIDPYKISRSCWSKNNEWLIVSGKVYSKDNLFPPKNNCMVIIDPKLGKVVDFYELPHFKDCEDNYYVVNSKVAWSYKDSVYVHNLDNKETSSFSVNIVGAEGFPKYITLSPNGSKIAFSINLNVANKGKRTYIYTCGLNGTNKTNLTIGDEIDVMRSTYSDCAPFWLNNNEILYAESYLYIITDEINPKITKMKAEISPDNFETASGMNIGIGANYN